MTLGPERHVFVLVDVASQKELGRITARVRAAVFLGEDRLITTDGSLLSLWRVPAGSR